MMCVVLQVAIINPVASVFDTQVPSVAIYASVTDSKFVQFASRYALKKYAFVANKSDRMMMQVKLFIVCPIKINSFNEVHWTFIKFTKKFFLTFNEIYNNLYVLDYSNIFIGLFSTANFLVNSNLLIIDKKLMRERLPEKNTKI